MKKKSKEKGFENGMTLRNPKKVGKGSTKWVKLGQVGTSGSSGTGRSGSPDLRGSSGSRTRKSSDRGGTSGSRTRGLSS